MKRLAAFAAGLAALAATPLMAKDEAADPLTETVHVVKAGETLGGIAQRAQVPRVLIIEANGLKPPFTVKAGQKLTIPRRRNHTVKPGETGFSIAMDYGVPWTSIAAASGIDSKAPVKAGQVLTIPTMIMAKPEPQGAAVVPSPAQKPAPTVGPTPAPTPTVPAKAKLPPDTKAPRFAWPLRGDIRRDFTPRGGKQTFHDGIDITAAKGDTVRASADGKVIFAGQGPKEYGQTVIVYHTGRWTTTYAFLDKITVKDGDKVKKGERIGLAGETGMAKGVELHFEVRRNREAQDPLDYLPQQGD